ncbi:MAG: hypothetical protein R3300_13330 [Candidatus Promineifilaceae bacterium]|nr:hypothetical protein [Candidatus Promineifilaceae bacterium]
MTLSLVGLLFLIVIAAIAGWIGQRLVGYTRGGIALAAAVGFIGALIGMWLSSALALPNVLTVQIEGQAFPFAWAVVGAVLLVAAVGFATRRGLF